MPRIDGRNNNELRTVTIQPHYTETPHGSVLIEMGKTKLLCTAMIEDNVPRFMKGQGKGWITAEYGMLPGATPERHIRDASRIKPDGRIQEIQRLIGRALRSVADMDVLGERTLWVDCDVIQADGGTRTAGITAGFVAAQLAVNRLIAQGRLRGTLFTDNVAAVSAGVVLGEAMLDLCYKEDSQADVDMNVVMTSGGKLVEIQGTAEKYPFSKDTLDELLKLADKGVQELIAIQKGALEK